MASSKIEAFPVAPATVGSNRGVGVRDADNAVVIAQQNLADGPATIYTLVLDNTADEDAGVGTNTKVFAKFYDIIDNTFVAGVAPRMVIPVPATTASVANVNVAGKHTIYMTPGVRFKKGISVLASQDQGDTVAVSVAADADFDIEIALR
jgi:hypothetical protein